MRYMIVLAGLLALNGCASKSIIKDPVTAERVADDFTRKFSTYYAPAKTTIELSKPKSQLCVSLENRLRECGYGVKVGDREDIRVTESNITNEVFGVVYQVRGESILSRAYTQSGPVGGWSAKGMPQARFEPACVGSDHAKSISVTYKKGTVKTDLRLRAKPNTKSDTLRILSRGETVRFEPIDYIWAKVQSGSLNGYAAYRFIREEK